MWFKNTSANADYKKKIYVKFPDTRPETLELLPELENPQFCYASGDNEGQALGNFIEGKLVSIEKKTWISEKYGNKLQAVITIETEEGELVVISSNMHNEMRKLLLKITQVDKIDQIGIGVYYIKDKNSGKRYFSTGVIADGMKLPKVDLDRDAEVEKWTMEVEVSKTGKSKYYYDNPMSETQEDLLGDPKFFDGILLAKAAKLGEYEQAKAAMAVEPDEDDVEPVPAQDEDDDNLPF